MSPKQIKSILGFIKGKEKASLIAETRSGAASLANVLFESKKLYHMLNDNKSSLESIYEQIKNKKAASKLYKKVTGKTWPL